jgi:hypothetical protein
MRVASTRLAAAPHAPPCPLRLLLLVLLASAPLAIGAAAMAGHILGGVKENPAAANSAESDGLGLFAVDEHNKRQESFSPPSRFLVPFSRALCDLVDSGFSF